MYLIHLNFIINFIILVSLGYHISIHHGCCKSNNEKVYIYSDHDAENSEKNAINQ